MTFVVFSIFYSSMSQFVVCSNTLRMRESMWSRSCGCVYNCIQSTLCSAFSPLLLLHRNICYKIEAKYKYKYFYHDQLNTFIFRYIYVFIKLSSLVFALFLLLLQVQCLSSTTGQICLPFHQCLYSTFIIFIFQNRCLVGDDNWKNY